MLESYQINNYEVYSTGYLLTQSGRLKFIMN
jgi:hypothetical protein